MILEVAILHVKPGQTTEFEAAFAEARHIISTMKGFVNLQLQHCLENDHQYILLVNWESLEDHTIGFRQSVEYQQWKSLLHHYYDPFPVVEHYRPVLFRSEPGEPSTGAY
ncbi:antibiotic biosynthesis monooxygenase [Chitinophaga horti]|uniref:Antibiotic biosynthesis monooxygenase n=1 Tax=Chitinophaga horti TaxID=2920382 RepID=A0ABY6IWI2_9BACT|nr:antibiotic biosynthesis monooxygenase [Chitinophaga horti]UYQ91737.1 antibiotic biosynthesis monooxygenase [Chitinophaga horti]